MIYEKLPVVLLSTLASEKKQTTNSAIASCILTNREEVSRMGIAELAERCHVGTGSISRFCRDVGFRDFSELKQLLSDTSFHFEEIKAEDDRMKADLWVERVSDSMKQAEMSMDLSKIRELCLDIRSFEKVSAYGMLKAETAAVCLQADLLMMGKNIHTSVAYAEQTEQILSAGKDELIIIFSYTGSYFNYQNFRLKEKHLVLPKIWMICGKGAEKPWFADEMITFDSDGSQISHPFQLQTAAGIIVQIYADLCGSGQ